MVTKGGASFTRIPSDYDYYGVSEDEKPVGGELVNGNSLYLIDVNQLWLYDEENHQWYLQPNVPGSEGGTGTNDYQSLINKPSINGVLLFGNKTNQELKISPLSNEEIESLFSDQSL